MSRVAINGQLQFNDCSSIRGFVGETKVDRQTTAFSLNRVHNWLVFCDEIDGILEDYTRMMRSFKSYYSFFIISIVAIGFIFLLPSSGFGGTLSRYISVLYIPLILGLVYFPLKENSIWVKVKRVCTERSGNGVRYELLDESVGRVKTRYIMVHYRP